MFATLTNIRASVYGDLEYSLLLRFGINPNVGYAKTDFCIDETLHIGSPICELHFVAYNDDAISVGRVSYKRMPQEAIEPIYISFVTNETG